MSGSLLPAEAMGRDEILQRRTEREYSKRWLIFWGFIFFRLHCVADDGIVLSFVTSTGGSKSLSI